MRSSKRFDLRERSIDSNDDRITSTETEQMYILHVLRRLCAKSGANKSNPNSLIKKKQEKLVEGKMIQG